MMWRFTYFKSFWIYPTSPFSIVGLQDGRAWLMMSVMSSLLPERNTHSRVLRRRTCGMLHLHKLLCIYLKHFHHQYPACIQNGYGSPLLKQSSFDWAYRMSYNARYEALQTGHTERHCWLRGNLRAYYEDDRLIIEVWGGHKRTTMNKNYKVPAT